MSSSLIIALEMGGVLGAVLLWGGWELWSLRRDRRKEAPPAEASKAAETPGDK